MSQTIATPDEPYAEEEYTYSLCDGCHSAPCICDEIAAQREQEFGPRCAMCHGDGADGYADCPFSHLYDPGECSQLTGVW